MPIIFGVDTTKPVSPLDVRNAMTECFYLAHCHDTSLNAINEPENRNHCQEIIKKAFDTTHGDYDNPTKESLLAVLEYLATFSLTFRDKEVIEKHKKEISTLLNLLPN